MPVAAMLLKGAAAGAGGGGAFYRSVTVDHTKVGTVDHTDFAVCFSGTYTYLKTVANGGKVQNANGYDITFSSDSAGVSLYKWEIESWDATTGVIVAWIKLPTVSHTSDTVFYLRYGDSGITTFQGDMNGTWNSAYLGVWHLAHGDAAVEGDSTANAQDISGTTSSVSGEIGNANGFNGAQERTNGVSSLASTSAWTLSAWAYITGGSSFRTIANLGTGSVRNMNIGIDGTPVARAIFTQGSLNFKVATGATTLSSSTWYYLVARYDGSAVQIFLNGASDGTTSVSGATDSHASWRVASVDVGSELFTGNIDEMRVSNVARSDSWILAEYNNQSSPSTFYTLGPET